MSLTDLSHLKPGDVLTLVGGRKRIVVRVIDATGELGGLVDTKALDGRYSRSAGFEAGRDIEAVEPGAAKGILDKAEQAAAGWPR